MKVKTSALYIVPKEGEQAKRFDSREFVSLSNARRARKEQCQKGCEVAIHVGFSHPEKLPFGSKLWREIK